MRTQSSLGNKNLVSFKDKSLGDDSLNIESSQGGTSMAQSI